MIATNNETLELNAADLDSVSGGGIPGAEKSSGSQRSGGGSSGGGVSSKLLGEFGCAVGLKLC